MLSPATEELLKKLLSEQPTYKPTPEILERLQHVTFVCFVGASGMGKTTLMDALAAYDTKYGKTRNFTSRTPRPDDDPKRYYYFEHTDEGLRPILDRIARHETLQYNINPFNLQMYGSEIEDYPHQFNVGDIFSSSIDGFRQLGFGKLYIFSVVTDAATWRKRLTERFPTGHPNRQHRLEEAIVSLEWSLSQTAADHAWVINETGSIEHAVQAVDRVICGDTPAEQPQATQLAQECLAAAKELLE